MSVEHIIAIVAALGACVMLLAVICSIFRANRRIDQMLARLAEDEQNDAEKQQNSL